MKQEGDSAFARYLFPIASRNSHGRYVQKRTAKKDMELRRTKIRFYNTKLTFFLKKIAHRDTCQADGLPWNGILKSFGLQTTDLWMFISRYHSPLLCEKLTREMPNRRYAFHLSSLKSFLFFLFSGKRSI